MTLVVYIPKIGQQKIILVCNLRSQREKKTCGILI